MTALVFLRLGNRALGVCGRVGLSHGGLLEKPLPSLGAIVPKQNLMLSPANKGRIYGPELDHEKKTEIRHWVNERLIATALLPIIPTALMYPSPLFDNVLVAGVMLHTHWRLSGVVGDYIHGPIMPKICKPAVLVFSILSLGGLLYFNYTDIGFANAVRLIYTQL